MQSKQWRQRWPHGCYHYHLLVCCYSLPCPVRAGWLQNYYWFVVLKGQRKEFLHKIKSENVTLAILLSRFCFHFCCDLFSHIHKEKIFSFFFFNIFSLFCKVLCVVRHWLRLILWTVFSFFSCAHKWLLTDCTNCTESTCCFLFCNTGALMMSHLSICFTFNSVQASWGISVGAWRGGSLKGLTHGNVTFVCHSFSS